MTALAFVLLVGVLIFVHELGHFFWAKFFGVKVLRFSLGFGPKIIGFRRGETEYVLAAIPLGGYVRMLGEYAADEVDAAEEGRSFNGQPLWRRVIIVLAGPAMNLVFPLLLYFVVYVGDRQMTPSIVGAVLPDRPADGQLEPGDRVTAVDDEPITTFYELTELVADAADRELDLTVDRRGTTVHAHVTPELVEDIGDLGIRRSRVRIGVSVHQPLAVIGVMSPASPAAAARLRTFDRIVAAAGRPIEHWSEFQAVVDGNRGATIPVTYLRPRRLDGTLRDLLDLELYEPHVAALTPEPGPGSGLLRAGLEPSDLYVARVRAGSPEARIGLRPGDRLEALDGVPLRRFDDLVADLVASADAPHELVWRRGDQVITRTLTLERERGVSEFGERYDRVAVGIENWAPTVTHAPVRNPSPVFYALSQSLRATWGMMELTGASMLRMLEGRLTAQSLGGPLMVMEGAETAARGGALDYLAFMAFISINLGLLNLLPIPMLDGGHLLFFLIETVIRRPIAASVRALASLVGVVILVMLMLVAFKNDVERRWPDIVEAFQTE